MPTLPGLDLSQAHYDRVVAAFPGSTLAEKAAAYRAWLANKLIEEVMRIEGLALDVELGAEKTRRWKAIEASLPPRQAYPPGSTTV